jgi:VWFA-related protein
MLRLMSMFSAMASAISGMVLLSGVAASAQTSVPPSSPGSQVTALSVRSNLVLVPALVKTKGGELVFALTADDFILTDNGVPQPLRLEPDTDAQPVALAIIVQTGGRGASHLGDYRDLDAVLDAVVGNVPHRVAVITFDSKPRLERDFTTDTDEAIRTISNLQEGGPGAAILDALNFGINLLRQQPQDYRRAVVLFSETIDDGSQTSFEEAIRTVDDTNTAIYSFGFSSTKMAVKHEGSKLPRPGGTPYESEPYAKGGCMSHNPDADPDAHGNRSVQALDCASDLIPPLRLGRMAYLAAKDGLQRNVPESVAQLTGGEYFAFKDAKTLSRHLITISNDAPNYYVLSFHPQSPLPGLHALNLRLKDRPELQLSARNSYWVDAVNTASNK